LTPACLQSGTRNQGLPPGYATGSAGCPPIGALQLDRLCAWRTSSLDLLPSTILRAPRRDTLLGRGIFACRHCHGPTNVRQSRRSYDRSDGVDIADAEARGSHLKDHVEHLRRIEAVVVLPSRGTHVTGKDPQVRALLSPREAHFEPILSPGAVTPIAIEPAPRGDSGRGAK
jgi:hypothetical protein